MDIAKRLKFFREQKGYTVNRLATQSGVAQSFVREIELGNKKPGVETLQELCRALDISLRDFFEEDYQKTLLEDELQAEIFRLNAAQRKQLVTFLKSMHGEG